jgi:hypothetical protein
MKRNLIPFSLTSEAVGRERSKSVRPVESDSVPPVVASVAALSPDESASSFQPDQPAGPLGGEVP